MSYSLYKSSIKMLYLYPMYETKITLIAIRYNLLMVYPCFWRITSHYDFVTCSKLNTTIETIMLLCIINIMTSISLNSKCRNRKCHPSERFLVCQKCYITYVTCAVMICLIFLHSPLALCALVLVCTYQANHSCACYIYNINYVASW